MDPPPKSDLGNRLGWLCTIKFTHNDASGQRLPIFTVDLQACMQAEFGTWIKHSGLRSSNKMVMGKNNGWVRPTYRQETNGRMSNNKETP